MKSILQLTLSLTLICAIAGASLAFVNNRTAAPKAAAQASRKARNMMMVMEGASSFSEPVVTGRSEYYEAYGESGELVGYVAEGSDPNGFGGEIRILVGITPEGRLTGVLVSSANETPGIGSRVCQRETRRSLWDVLKGRQEQAAKGLPPNKYLDRYTGCQLGSEPFVFGRQYGGIKTLKPVSGATISSAAVLNAVNAIRASFADAQKQLPKSANLQEEK